jgi:transcriptional regulator with XRE-family HTH domain
MRLRYRKLIARVQCQVYFYGVTTNTWPLYLSAITDGQPGARIAERTGLPESTISRWLSDKAEPRPKQVVAVARAYGQNPVEALIAAGYLGEGEIDVPSKPTDLSLRAFTTLALSKEMVRRLEEGTDLDLIQSPLDENHPAMQKDTDRE